MPGITLAQAQAHLDAANDAYAKALTIASTAREGRQSVYQQLDLLQRAISLWDRKVQELSGGAKGRDSAKATWT